MLSNGLANLELLINKKTYIGRLLTFLQTSFLINKQNPQLDNSKQWWEISRRWWIPFKLFHSLKTKKTVTLFILLLIRKVKCGKKSKPIFKKLIDIFWVGIFLSYFLKRAMQAGQYNWRLIWSHLMGNAHKYLSMTYYKKAYGYNSWQQNFTDFIKKERTNDKWLSMLTIHY